MGTTDSFTAVLGERRGLSKDEYRLKLEKTYGPLPHREGRESDETYWARLREELDLYKLKLEKTYCDTLPERNLDDKGEPEDDAQYGERMNNEWGPIGPMGLHDFPSTEDGSDYFDGLDSESW